MSNEEEEINGAVDSAAAETENAVVETQSDGAQTVKDSVEETTANDAEKSAEPIEPAKGQADAPAAKSPAQPNKKSGAMNKLFKLIYFPLVAVLVVVMTVFSIVDAVCGYSPKAYDDGYYTAAGEITGKIAAISRSDMTSDGTTAVADEIVKTLGGAFKYIEQEKPDETLENPEDEIYTTIEWAREGGAVVPTVTRFTETPSAALQSRHSLPVFTAGKEITDIIAAIPSEATRLGNPSSAVIVTVRYDSRADSTEAALASFVGATVASLNSYVSSGAIPKNDIVVVFTEDMDCAYGTYAFVDMFDGLGDVVSRAKAAVNLEAYGNGGTLAVTDATKAGLAYFNEYTSVSGTAFNSSIAADAVPAEMKMTAAVDALASAGIPTVQVAVLGDINNAQSAADGYANLPQSTLYMQADFIKSYFDEVGGTDKIFDVNGNELVFFSYFDFGTVAYDNIAAYVVGAIILAVLIGAIVLNVLKKTFSLYRMLVAVGVQLLVMASAVAAMFAAYFLVTLMLTGFGVIPIHAITELRYFNAGILIAAMLIAFASTFGFTTVYKKLFKVTSSDTVRGNAVLVAIVAAVFSFVAPAYSFVVSWLGLLFAATLLATVCLNKKFKARFGYGMDRLFPFVIPVLITLPITMSTVTSLASLWPLYLLPIVMTVFVALLGSAVPYLDRSVAVFDRLAKKLPMRTQRVERTVTERVEDRAKKGKFTERTVRRVEKEKVPVNYKNYFGISLVAVIGIVTALLSGGFGASFGQTITVPHTYSSSIYNDSIVYEWNKTSGGTVSQRIVVGDLITYKYARYAVDGLEWDSSLDMYTKSVNYNVSDVIPNEPKVERSSDVYQVTTFDGPRSTVTISIPSARSITKITVTNDRDIEYDYYFNHNDNIVLRMPYGFGNFTMKFEGSNPTTVYYEEKSAFMSGSLSNPLANVDEWNLMLQYYRDTEIASTVRGGIVLKATYSL